jgi:hypothetical protein
VIGVPIFGGGLTTTSAAFVEVAVVYVRQYTGSSADEAFYPYRLEAPAPSPGPAVLAPPRRGPRLAPIVPVALRIWSPRPWPRAVRIPRPLRLPASFRHARRWRSRVIGRRKSSLRRFA